MPYSIQTIKIRVSQSQAKRNHRNAEKMDTQLRLSVTKGCHQITNYVYIYMSYKGKGKESHYRPLDRPIGFQEFQAPKFQDNRRMKVVRLSALRTGRLSVIG
jgi:hypothetical protein